MRRTQPQHLVGFAVTTFLAATCAGSAKVEGGLVSATNFVALPVGSSASFDRIGFDGIDDMTITYNSGNFVPLQFFTTPSVNNPSEIASQTVPWFLPAGGNTSGVLTIDFATPLASGDKLFFVDFDSLERVTISGSNGGNAVSTLGWTLGQFEGSGAATSAATWTPATGVLTTGAGGRTNPVDVLTVDSTIDQLVYNIDQPFGTVGFNFATQLGAPATVPEPTTLAVWSILGVGMVGMRRKKNRHERPA